MILADRSDSNVAQGRTEVVEIIAGRLVPAQATVGTHPNCAFSVGIEGYDRIGRQGTDVALAMPIMADIARRRIEDIQSLIQSAGPDAAASVDEERAHRIAGQSIRAAG